MPTEEEFKQYVKVQRGGQYNMFDSRARIAAGLEKSTYFAIMGHYDELAKLYPDTQV